MQSDYLLNTLPNSQQKLTQLNFKLKKWRVFTLILVISVVFLSTLLLYSAFHEHKKSINSSIIKSQQQFQTETCSNIQLNNTNLTAFSLKLAYKNPKQEQLKTINPLIYQTTKIVSLDLSSNSLLETVSDNNLPDLENLKLQNNWVKNFSNNNFPKLTDSGCSYRFWQIKRFQNNSLPLVKFSDNFRINYFDYFNYNYMPNLAGQQEFFKFTQLIGNTLGVTSLRIQSNENGFQFYKNTLKQLKKLVFFCSDFRKPINSTKFNNNQFPNLKYLSIFCNLVDFSWPNQKQLQSIYLGIQKESFQSFSNRSLPQLKSLRLQGATNFESGLKLFTNNKLPKLEQLVILNSKLTDICTGNQMPNIKSISIQELNNQLNFNCFNNFQNLENLFAQLKYSIQNVTFPNLKNFTLIIQTLENKEPFINNSFPLIQRFIVYNFNAKNFNNSNISLGSNLQYFQLVYSNLQSFSFDKSMPNLEHLQISDTKLQNFDCSTFKNIKKLLLSGNKLKDDIIDVLIDCNFTKIAYIYLDSNLITDTKKARAKLSSRYPTTTILI